MELAGTGTNLDRKIKGLPRGINILLESEQGQGATLFAKHFLLDGLEKGEKCVFISLDYPKIESEKHSHQFMLDFSPYIKDYTFVDLYDMTVEGKLTFSFLAEKVRELKRGRVVVDSLTGLLILCHHVERSSIRYDSGLRKLYWKIIKAFRKPWGNPALIILNPKILEKAVLSYLEDVFPMVMRMKIIENKRYLQIIKSPLEWQIGSYPFKITHRGLVFD